MKCPKCGEYMEKLRIYGTEEEVRIDYHCAKCQTLASLTWHPHKEKAPTS